VRAVLPDHVALVDSAATVAAAVARELPGAANPSGRCGLSRLAGVSWLATDGAARFARVSGIFLGEALRPEDVEIIDL
jgi:glutamate racemase